MNMFEADGFKNKNHKMLQGSYGIDNKNEVLAHSTTYENLPCIFLLQMCIFSPLQCVLSRLCVLWGYSKQGRSFVLPNLCFSRRLEEGYLSTHKTTKGCH